MGWWFGQSWEADVAERSPGSGLNPGCAVGCIVDGLGREAPIPHRWRVGGSNGGAVFKVWAGARTVVSFSSCGRLSKEAGAGIPRRSVRPVCVGGVIWRFAWGSAGVGGLAGLGWFVALRRRFGAFGGVSARPGGAVPWGSGVPVGLPG